MSTSLRRTEWGGVEVTLIDVGHLESLNTLPDLVRAAVLPDLDGGVRVTHVGWVGDPHWRTMRSARVWSRSLAVVVEDADQGIGQAVVEIPWMCHDGAAEHPLTGEPTIGVGTHHALWWGQPRTPLLVTAPTPGLHVWAEPRLDTSPTSDDADPADSPPAAPPDGGPAPATLEFVLSAAVVPDVGPWIRCEVVTGDAAWPPPDDLGSRLANSRRRYFAADTLAAIDPSQRSNVPLLTIAALRDDLLVIVPESEGDTAAAPDWAELRGDPAHTRLLRVGDVVAEALVPTLRTVARWVRAAEYTRAQGQLTVAETSALVLQRLLARQIQALMMGRGRLAGCVVPATQRNSLDQLEQARMVTWVTAWGYGRKRFRGRTDLRDLHPNWRYGCVPADAEAAGAVALCPVHTRENTDIGLIRFAALGAAAVGDLEDRADLSASAALIPFIGHDDPARAILATKTMRQALPLAEPEAPFVRTGAERLIGEHVGCVRSPTTGRVADADWYRYRVTSTKGHRAAATLSVGSCRVDVNAGTDRPLTTWTYLRGNTAPVDYDEVLAHAPDTVLETTNEGTEPVLALGVNAMVALLPWHGLNYEDGVVVSEAFARRMSSRHEVVLEHPLPFAGHGLVEPRLEPGAPVERGDTLAVVRAPGREDHYIHAPEGGEFRGLWYPPDREVVLLELAVRRSLQIGDKITNRHQGKGVVCAILPDHDMPRIDATGHEGVHLPPIDVLLNPVGVLRRLSFGQLWEMHAGLASWLDGHHQVLAGRTVPDRQALATRLADHGFADGRARIVDGDGIAVGPDEGVVIGPQYLLKLDHLASAKASARGGASRSPRSAQPVQRPSWEAGIKSGSPQRLGEMEIWGLLAAGADEVLWDAIHSRGAAGDPLDSALKPSLRAVQAHLSVAGVHLGYDETRDEFTVDVADPGDSRLQPLTPTDLKALADRRQGTDTPHPLHSEAHGSTGLQREEVQWRVDLPFPVPHPWRALSSRGGPGVLINELPDLTALPILPPAYRSERHDPLDRAYASLARAIHHYDPDSSMARAIREAGVAQQRSEIPYARDWEAEIIRCVAAILGDAPSQDRMDPESIQGRLSGKSGLLRRWTLGHAVTHSARGVIVGDPRRDPQTVGVPHAMLNRLIGEHANDEDCSDVVVLNRQPTLRPYTLIALRAEPVSGDALVIHPSLLGNLAGDFDGDTVALHWPVRAVARRQAWTLLRPGVNVRSAARAQQLLTGASLDVALGLHLASSTQHGRQELANAIQLNTSTPLNADALNKELTAIAAGLEGDAGITYLTQVMDLGFRYAAHWGVSAVDLRPLTDLEQLTEGSSISEQRIVQALAGGCAKRGGVEQLLVRRGSSPGYNPLFGTKDVPSGWLAGVPADDYFAATYGALRGVADKKLLTPRAGALTKSLVEICYEVTVAGSDCEVAAAPRSPLTCADPRNLCQVCMGDDPRTDSPFPIGSRVGILAGMLIGERSTQLSMKAFQQGGSAAGVTSDIGDLEAIFGAGSDRVIGKLRPLFQNLSVASGTREAVDLQRGLQPVVERFSDIMQGQVDERYAEIVLRQLWEAHDIPIPEKLIISLAQVAEQSRAGILGKASERGSLKELLIVACWHADQERGLLYQVSDSGRPIRKRLLVGRVLEGAS